MSQLVEKLRTSLRELNQIGVALSVERDQDRLQEMILQQARKMTNADGGTLYRRTDDDRLQFEIMMTESLGIHLGGTSGEKVPFYPIALYDEDGKANNHMVAACSVLQDTTINIPDAYSDQQFDFSGTRKFDEKTGYRSRSFLTVPMKNHENHIIGVLQLLNARDEATGEVRPFTELDQQLVESLASQAAVGMTNQELIASQKRLFESFIRLIASAIDAKSPYTGGHCRRVPELTDMIALACCEVSTGPLADFTMTEAEKYELNIAGWLHDCGKVATPEYVVDKATKLQTIFDRMEMIDTRFAVLQRDLEIAELQRQLAEVIGNDAPSGYSEDYAARMEQLKSDRRFLHRCNIGGEFMTEADQDRVRKIAAQVWRDADDEELPFLSENEVYNLNIAKGTLTSEERKIINDHMAITIRMLESLPYPKELRNVQELAGGHHERMDGKGYPKGLKREEMSVPARMMAVADIFEALTARDRPYKKGMKLSQALSILGRMKLDQHIDPDIFDVFIGSRIYLKYAEKFLEPEQIDDVDVAAIPGYTGTATADTA